MGAPTEHTFICEGWWEQDDGEWHPMHRLVLTFSHGKIRGRGYDHIGPFTLAGNFVPSGLLIIQKQYSGKHEVEYVGSYEGERVLQGQWSIDHSFGRWVIVIKSEVVELGSELHEISS